jgi:hypothetical protein
VRIPTIADELAASVNPAFEPWATCSKTVDALEMGFMFYPESRHRSGYAADCDVVVCYGAAKLADKHLSATVHCVDDEIIGWLKRCHCNGLRSSENVGAAGTAHLKNPEIESGSLHPEHLGPCQRADVPHFQVRCGDKPGAYRLKGKPEPLPRHLVRITVTSWSGP